MQGPVMSEVPYGQGKHKYVHLTKFCCPWWGNWDTNNFSNTSKSNSNAHSSESASVLDKKRKSLRYCSSGQVTIKRTVTVLMSLLVVVVGGAPQQAKWRSDIINLPSSSSKETVQIMSHIADNITHIPETCMQSIAPPKYSLRSVLYCYHLDNTYLLSAV